MTAKEEVDAIIERAVKTHPLIIEVIADLARMLADRIDRLEEKR